MPGEYSFKVNSKPSIAKEGVSLFENTQAQNLEALWAKERKEGDPEIKIHFVFGYHLNDLDLNRLRQEFLDTDVFIPEIPAAGAQVEKIYQNISAGTLSVAELTKNAPYLDSFTVGSLKMIYRSRKPIVLVDFPPGHEIEKEHASIEKLIKRMRDIRGLHEKIAIMKEVIGKQVATNRKRDDLIAQQIPQRIRRLLDGNPKLRKKSLVKVLIFLGVIHTPVYIKTKESKSPDVTRSFDFNGSNKFLVYQFSDELLKRVTFGQDITTIDEELWERTVFGADLGRYFFIHYMPMTEKISGKELIDKVRYVSQSLSKSDIEDIYEAVAKGKSFMDATLQACKTKNINIITS